MWKTKEKETFVFIILSSTVNHVNSMERLKIIKSQKNRPGISIINSCIS